MRPSIKPSIKLSRRNALVAAGVAGLTTLLAGSAVLVLGAQGGAGSVLRAGAASTDATAVVTEVQYDDTYAIVGDSPADASAGTPSAPVAAVVSAPEATSPPTVAPTVSGEDRATVPSDDGDHHEETPKPAPTTTKPPTPTTVPSPTTVLLYPKDLPPGWEIPENWPETKPLPPIPPGCRLGHLEDNGKWNCEH